jgi:hypothetical protein
LEKGTFRWPQGGESTIALSGAQLMELLAGREVESPGEKSLQHSDGQRV